MEKIHPLNNEKEKMKIRNPFKFLPFFTWREDAKKSEKWFWSIIIFSIGIGFLIKSGSISF